MNTIDAWRACDPDGNQWYFVGDSEPGIVAGIFRPCMWGYRLMQAHGHAINPGECRPVKLRVEVVG